MKPAHAPHTPHRLARVLLRVILGVQAVLAMVSASVQAQTNWATQNRFLEINTGSYQQNYREQDTQSRTVDGILDTETGRQNHIGVAASWQTQNGWLLGVTGQRQTGATDYQGYLQNGNGDLRPYNSRTGNTASQLSVYLGYAVNSDNWPTMPASLQVTPLLQWGQQRWQRNLSQYSESYRFQTYAAGVLAQWQAKPGLVLHTQALFGRVQKAQVSVEDLAFNSSQPGGNWRQWQIGLSQDLGTLTGKEALLGWRVAASYSASRFGHGQSPVFNGLQAPPNQHRPSVWTLGLQKQL